MCKDTVLCACDYRETSMAEDFVSETEETLIQSVVHDYQESPERQYSSNDDPYTRLTYSDLSEELKLVNERKCLAFVSQLLLLLGRKCRVDGCDADIATTSVGTDCGFAVKLSWECTAHHKYVCKTICQFRGYTYVCTIIAEITGTHHQPMLLDLPSTILSTRQFYFQDWGFSSFYDFVNLLA